MADNVTTQSGTLASAAAGTIFAFDEIGGVKHARSKTGFGADGSYTDVSASDPLPVVQTGTPALPTGAATAANQSTLIGHVDGIEGLLTTIDADTGALAAAVSGSEMQVDVVTSALPTGAATAAKQPALGTAGTASADVITVQGIASMTALKVDGSAVTQPVSAASLPLPTGAATLGEQQSQTTLLGTIDADTGAIATSVATVAGAVSGTEVQVDVLTMPTVTVQDGGGSLTVDAPVGTPVFVRLSDGASAIATLPVSLASVPSHAVTNAGTFAVQESGGALTALQVIDDWDESDRAKVNPIVGQAGVQGGSGAVSATTQRVVLATDVALPAGTNAIGKLAANSGVDIGDVDVTSTVLPTANTQAAVTSVADTATSTTLLSSSGARKGFRITNTSSAVLYVKYGTTASATDFTVRLPQWAYLEENFYSGRVDAVWSSDPGDGAALITSLSA